MVAAVVLVPIAYLLGSFPTAVLVARARGIDVTAQGSGNPGASNVARLAGWRYGSIVLTGDFLKGAVAAGTGYAVAGRPAAYLLGVAAVVGHTFPPRRRGGKGVAAAGGLLAVLFPVVVAVLAAVWLTIARLLGKASVASLVVTVAFPVTVALLGYAGWEVAVVGVMAVLIVARHAANIRRLVARREIDLP